MACVHVSRQLSADFILVIRKKAANARQFYLCTLDEMKQRTRDNDRVSLQDVFDRLHAGFLSRNMKMNSGEHE